MSVTGCEPLTAALTNLLGQPALAAALRQLMQEGTPIEAQIAVMQRFADDVTTATALREFKELPRITAVMILQAWELADRAGKRFEIVSTRPAQPLDFARQKRVRIVVDSEDDGVRVGLSHVPGRHAQWYAPVG